MKRALIGIAVIFAVLAAVAYPTLAKRAERQRLIQQTSQVTLPPPAKKPSRERILAMNRQANVVSHVNWDVPFTPQAPTANWDADHEDACEEASVAMVLRYFDGQTFASPADAEKQIRHLLDENANVLQYPKDQTAQQVAALLAKENPHLRISVVAHPTQQSLKQALSLGYLAIVPLAGRQVGNPYYRAPGPLYHMLVIRGYTDDGYVITNDPGTKHGKEYLYPWEKLLPTIHDWNGGDVEHGDPVAILIGQYIIGSSATR